jgi:hypothetical protein
MKHYKTLTELHSGNGWDAPEHPLFSMIGCQAACPLEIGNLPQIVTSSLSKE